MHYKYTWFIFQDHTKCCQSCSLKRNHYEVLLLCAQPEGQGNALNTSSEQSFANTEYFLSAYEHGATEQHRQIIFVHLPEKGSVNSLEFCRMRFITSCAASYLVICITHSCQPPDLIIPCFQIHHPPEIPSYVLKYVTTPSKL